MIKNLHASMSASAVVVGVTIFLAGCTSTGKIYGAPRASPLAMAASSAPVGNTAQICASSGIAARNVVIDLVKKVAEARSLNEKDSQAALTKVYQETFVQLSKQMGDAAAEANDPAFSAVLTQIAGEADRIATATATNPATVDLKGLPAMFDKLEQYCPSTSKPQNSTSEVPGGINGAVGTAESGCDLPVTFKVADKWKPEALDIEDDNPLVDLARMGPYELVCEIDAKPAGPVGYLRVWVDPQNSLSMQAALTPFVTPSATRNVVYAERMVGGLGGTDVSFQTYKKRTDEWVPRRAFAVHTPGGMVVLELAGLDAEEHEAMVPAYELALSTLVANP